MRRLLSAFAVALALCRPALASFEQASPGGPPADCAQPGGATATASLQLAQSSCRGNCNSRRGYCLSSCREGDRQCRAICNDLYQSCLSSCR
jgi:hypothetical protein